MKAFIQLFLLITVLQAFHQPAVSAQSAASAPPGSPQLRLEVGKTYCFEYGYRWALPWSISVPGSSEERSEEHTSELQSLMRITYAVFCLKYKNSPSKLHNRSLHNSH